MKSTLKKMIGGVVAVGIVAGLVGAFLIGHKEAQAEAESDEPIKAPTRVAVMNGETVVTLDAATRASAGVVVAPLQGISSRANISAYGMVVDLGDLTDMRNTVATAKAQLAKADAVLVVAHKEYDRVKKLFDAGGNAAERSVETAEGELRVDEANQQAAKVAFDVAGANAQQRWGNVVATWLTNGGSEFQRLRGQHDLLVQATIAPAQGAIEPPSEASVRTPAGQMVDAKFVSVATRTDPKIQGPSYFYLVTAAKSGLLPGMNVMLLLPVGEPQPGTIVPNSAVVWLQGKPWAYVQIKPDQFTRREISVVQPTKDGWVQPADFGGGASAVVQGPQVLLSEEFRAQISVGD